MTDERIEKIEWAATQWPYGWLARTALEVIREMQERERAKDEALRDALSCLESPRASVVAKINAALAQQPADAVVSQNDADPGHNAACGSQDAVDQPAQGERLEFAYTNWRGKRSQRSVVPIRLWHGSTEWHPEPQWFLRAWDQDKQAERDFALADIDWPHTLERAAQVADQVQNFWHEQNEPIPRFGAKQCADAIRNLRGDT